MNKILIFAKSKESLFFLKKIKENYNYLGEYYIVYENDYIKSELHEFENFKFYKINFHSNKLYKEFFYKDLSKIYIFVKNKEEAFYILSKVKDKNIPIVFINFWLNVEIPSLNHIDVISVPDIVVNRAIDYLPEVPLYARNIGLGEGEILEVEVPPYSSFAYRRVNLVNKENLRVAAIYRNGKLKLVDGKTLILPNDKLILIGKPELLREVFFQIKRNIGIFPQPFGQNIYLLLDMKLMKENEVSKLLKTAIYLHRKLKSKRLIVKVINPTLSISIYKLNKFKGIDIITDFFETDYISMLKKDLSKYVVGLIITNNKLFYKYTEDFYFLKTPILKSGDDSIKKCESIKVILNNTIRAIIPTIFDIDFQLNKKLVFIEADPENHYTNLIEYINNFKKLFHFKNIGFEKMDNNPVFELKKSNHFCLITPFVRPVKNRLLKTLFPSIEDIYIFLDKFNQFLIPINRKDEK